MTNQVRMPQDCDFKNKKFRTCEQIYKQEAVMEINSIERHFIIKRSFIIIIIIISLMMCGYRLCSRAPDHFLLHIRLESQRDIQSCVSVPWSNQPGIAHLSPGQTTTWRLIKMRLLISLGGAICLDCLLQSRNPSTLWFCVITIRTVYTVMESSLLHYATWPLTKIHPPFDRSCF